MFDNDNRPDAPAIVGFLVVVAVAAGVILAAAGGVIDQPQEPGLTGGDSIGTGATPAPNGTDTPDDASPTPTTESTSAETSAGSTDGDDPTDTPQASGSGSSAAGETDAEAEAATPTETESSDGSEESSSGSEQSSDGSSDSSTSSSESTGDDGDTDTATATPTATSTGTQTETAESDRPDGDLGLFECEEDAADGSSSCQIRLTEEPDGTEPSWEYDMPVADNYAHWLLSHERVFGLSFGSQQGQQYMLVHYGGGGPDLPSYTANGIETRMILTDAMPHYGPPPDGYEWEPLPDRSYEYELEISDSAARTVLSHDDVIGVKAGLHGGVVFYVTSEEFAEEAPEEIEGHSMEYSVVEEVAAPDR